MCSYAPPPPLANPPDPTSLHYFLPLGGPARLFECFLQTQAPTATSDCRSSTYIQEHRNAPCGICKLVSSTSSQRQHSNYRFLAVFSNQTTRNPIVSGFNCAPPGCWLVTQQARVAYLREVNSVSLYRGLATAYTHSHTHTQTDTHTPSSSVHQCLKEQRRSPAEPITRTALISRAS